MTRRARPQSAQPREDHGTRLRRLVGELAAELEIRHGLSPEDAIFVAEGAAARIRYEAEELKKARRVSHG